MADMGAVDGVLRAVRAGFGGGVMRDALADWGIFSRDVPRLGEEISRAARIASDNFRRIHGVDPHPLMNIYTLVSEYAHIPTWEELAARTAVLSQRIEAAKVKHGIA